MMSEPLEGELWLPIPGHMSPEPGLMIRVSVEAETVEPDFFEADESLEDILNAFHSGPKGVTSQDDRIRVPMIRTDKWASAGDGV